MSHPSADSPEPAAEQDTPRREQRPSWEAVLRAVGLAAVATGMVWLAFNVELPDRDALRATIEGFGWWSWLVFTGAYALVALTPIPVTLMALTGGALFGVFTGSLLSVIGAMAGSVVAYWIARFLGKEMVLGLLGSHRDTLETYLGSAGFQAVFTLRVLPGMPYWPINYGSGALNVPFREFTLASAIASVPGQISLVAIGAFAASPSIAGAVIVVVAWISVIVLTIMAGRAWKRSTRRTPEEESDHQGEVEPKTTEP